jgi:sporulation protein YlmC with PRC-barrel domain
MAIQEKNYEGDNRTGINHEGDRPNEPAERLTAKSIIGDKIENLHGEDLGKINNLMINLQEGKIEYVIVEFGSFLGMGGKLFALPFSEFRLNQEKKMFILNRDKEYLKTSPGFDKMHWPDTNGHDYFKTVDSYYGTPVPPF